MFKHTAGRVDGQGSQRLTLPHWLAAGALERVVQELRRWEGAGSISRFHQGSWAGVRLVVSSGMPLC